MGAASVRKYTIDGRAARPFAAVVHREKSANLLLYRQVAFFLYAVFPMRVGN
jgi:hypothetical protein